MAPVIRMFLFLAAGGILSAVAIRMLDTLWGWLVLGLAGIAFFAGIWNFYRHARTRWPFKRNI